MVGGKQEMDIKGNGETRRESGVSPVFQMAEEYGGHKAAKPAEKTTSNEKISFTCLFLKM